jgi:hypothetical protein
VDEFLHSFEEEFRPFEVRWSEQGAEALAAARPRASVILGGSGRDARAGFAFGRHTIDAALVTRCVMNIQLISTERRRHTQGARTGDTATPT